MKSNLTLALTVGAAALACASAAFAGNQPGPAPLMGAGLPGLIALVTAGGGYVALRLRRRDRD
ncbi:MAG: hypothetical protein ACJ798_06055 [Phenylobacterium sp.]